MASETGFDVTAEQIETTFRNWVSGLTDGEWTADEMSDTWVIFTNETAGLQAEIGVREQDDSVFLKVYDIPALTGETHLDVTRDADRNAVLGGSPSDVISDSMMSLAGAVNGAA